MKVRNFAAGAVILMLAALIARVIGFVYRIYLSNLIGAEGMGLFQLISPVYSLVILTLTSGISIAVSKMVAFEVAKNNPVNPGKITHMALVIIVAAGAASSLLIIANLDFISNKLLGDPRTYLSLFALVPCIPFIAAASALKGYFYGIQDVVPTAISQIAEQVARMALLYFTASVILKLGLEYACALATVGMAVGEIVNASILAIMYAVRRKKERRTIAGTAAPRPRICRRKISILKEMFRISIPVSANRFITSAMAAAEMILIPARLLAGGMDYRLSMETFGKLMGMAMPLIYFPSVVTSSLAVTLVPAISEALSLNNRKLAASRISKSIQISFLIGFLFMIIFLSFPNGIGNLFYGKENIGDILYILSFSCIFIYLQQTLTGIMNGLGKQGIALRNSLIGYVIRIAAVYFFVPLYGIGAYIASLIISALIVCALNMITAVRITGLKFNAVNWIVKPGIAGLLAFLSSKFINSLVFGIFSSYSLSIISGVFIMSIIFIGTAYLIRTPFNIRIQK